MKRVIWMIISIMSLVELAGQDGEFRDGLVGYWSFDQIQAGGIVKDFSGLKANGEISGSAHTKGIKGNALRFDGEDDVVTIVDVSGSVPAHISSLSQGTISLWFKLDQIPEGKGIQPIFYFGSWSTCSNMFDAANQGIIIEVGHHPVHWDSKSLYFTIFSNGCSVPSFCFDSWEDMEPDRWYHFVAVVGEEYNTGYLDGKPMELLNYNFGNSTYSQFFENAKVKDVMWLGKGYWDAETYFLEGSIDELRIYNRPLTAREVKDLYGMTLSTGIQPDPVLIGDDIFPNPVKDVLNVRWSRGPGEILERMVITGTGGKEVLVADIGNGIAGETISGEGWYLLRIDTNERSEVVRVMKTK